MSSPYQAPEFSVTEAEDERAALMPVFRQGLPKVRGLLVIAAVSAALVIADLWGKTWGMKTNFVLGTSLITMLMEAKHIVLSFKLYPLRTLVMACLWAIVALLIGAAIHFAI